MSNKMVADVMRATELYRVYRAAVTAHPYDPIEAGRAFTEWHAQMRSLSARAKRQAGLDILQDTYDTAAVEREALALPLAAADTLRLLTHLRVLLEGGASLEALLVALAAAATPEPEKPDPLPNKATVRGDDARTFTSYQTADGRVLVEHETDMTLPWTEWPVVLQGEVGGRGYSVREHPVSGVCVVERETAGGVDRHMVASQHRAWKLLALANEVEDEG